MSIPPRPDLVPPAQPPVAVAPPATWRWYEALGVWLLGMFVTVTILGAIAESFVDSGPGYFLLGLLSQILPTLGLLLWLKLGHPGWGRMMGVIGVRGADIGYGVVAGLATFVGVTAISWVIALVYQAVEGTPLETPDQVPVDLTGITVVLAILVVVIGAPLTEELFFRGCLFKGVRARRSFWPAALLSGVLFGLAHWDFEAGVPLVGKLTLVVLMVVVGISFAWFYERRGSLWTAVSAHMMFNIIGLWAIAVAS